MRGTLRRYLIFGFWLVLSILVGVGFNNCGNVKLTSALSSVNVSSAVSAPSYLAVPENAKEQLRFILLVDMSASMVRNSCPGDIDSATPMADNDECNALETPSDPEMFRLQVIQNWLKEMEKNISPEALSRLKVAIIPFTGGSYEENRGDMLRMNFTDSVSARNFIDVLAAQQETHLTYLLNNDSTAMSPTFMGTSVPSTRLGLIQDMIKAEIEQLKKTDDLENSNFQVVFISDGHPKPMPVDVKNTMNRIWEYRSYARGPGMGIGDYKMCIPQCSKYLDSVLEPSNGLKIDLGPELNGCSKTCLGAIGTYYSDSDVNGNTVISPQELISDMGLAWGDYTRNRPLDILQRVQQIRNVFLANTEAKFNFHFEYVNKSQNILAANPADNWVRLARSVFKKSSNHGEITGPKQAKVFFPQTQSSVSYQLKDLYVVNLNARVDKYGSLAVDSDGDGLFDDDEMPENRLVARSNGICLDSVSQKYGCLTKGCDPKLDQDGDGLNECEEITLGTDAYDFDSEGDGIPDSLEIVFGLDPSRNDRLIDSNSDGYTNFENYKVGLPAGVYLEKAKSIDKVSLSLEFNDYKSVSDGERNLFMAGYVAQLRNLPIVTVDAVSQNAFDLFYSKSYGEKSRISSALLGGNHGVNENRVIFLGYVQSITNPGDGYWVFQQRRLPYQQQGYQIELDLQAFRPIFARDPAVELAK